MTGEDRSSWQAFHAHNQASRRRSLRRAVALECQLECDSWAEPVLLPATDVSDQGLWVETPLALERGEELVVSFTLPNAPSAPRLWAIAEVARVGLWRRRNDPHRAGMGLVFTYCDAADLNRLSRSLLGRPPRLPVARRPPALPKRAAALVEISEVPPVLDFALALS